MFDAIKTFCIFIGYGKSGHTLIGALLDAHPNIVLSIELNALKIIQDNPLITKDKLFKKIINRAKQFRINDCIWTNYSYEVPGQYQGKFARIKVIGDKKGGNSSLLLRKDLDLLDQFRDLVNMEIKLIHVMRNPFDIIATGLKHRRQDWKIIETFNKMAEGVNLVKEKIYSDNLFDIKHEEFLRKPREILYDLCSYLNVIPHSDYLNACASTVRSKPHESRHEIDWPDNWIEDIQNIIDRYIFLKHYSFEL